MKIRVLIVDDEPVARQRVRRFLKGETDVEVIGECGDGESAITEITRQRPDLVFLDVQMPELDGFQVVAAIGAAQMPGVIFVTAHDEFALKAFEAEAIGYLLKPVGEARFRAALQRARTFLAGHPGADWPHQLAGLLARLPAKPPAPPFAVRTDGRIVLVPPAEIDWIEAEGDYVRIHAGAETHLLRAHMHELETRLGPEQFFRIHRSTLVNLEAVKEVRPVHEGESVVVLRSGRRLTASRTGGRQLQERLAALG